ncbi:GL13209 [Drosophila persimilis]|uniref:GL13209 n=1 Tax=Drosophila persimilis TaxID=7234 RepID=B4HD90_DROPE|nr:GL13209 [Drosophila persimilis]
MPAHEHSFVGRRGCPQRVNCDNATNFVGASRHFSELRRKIEAEADAIREFASRSGCEFAFIPPRAPHMGGLWEAGVKSAKGLLLRAVGSALLTAEELETVLVGIEAVLNSLPLGPLSPDPSDGDALTPGHLLTGGPLIAPPAPRTPDQEGLSCLKRWRLVSSARQMFWQRWSREYVLGLQIRCKWHQEEPNIMEGDLVIVAEDNLPPQQWLLGSVVGTTAGQDGRVRVVELRTSSGATFRRPIHKLALLPMV